MYTDLVQDMFEDSSTSVKCICGVAEDLIVEIDVWQGCILSSCLFFLERNEVSKEIDDGVAIMDCYIYWWYSFSMRKSGRS